LISTATVALMSTGALAADLPIYEPPPVVEAPPTVYDWSGFYIGLHVGGAFLTGDEDTSLSYNGAVFAPGLDLCPVAGCPTSFGDDGDDGFLAGGAHAGWQGQWGVWVAGLEVDITYLDLDDDGSAIETASFAFAAPATDVFQSTGFNDDDEENNLFGTVRGRLGVAFDRVLVYGTGGLALTSSENTEAFVGFGRGSATATAQGTPFAVAYSEPDSDDEDDIALGFAAGGGFEVALTDNFIVGAEALYFSVENDDDGGTLTCDGVLGSCAAPGDAAATIDVGGDDDFEGVIARVRGSYKW
jgi:outer membrane immunogenic protein